MNHLQRLLGIVSPSEYVLYGLRPTPVLQVALEIKPADCWIGAYFEKRQNRIGVRTTTGAIRHLAEDQYHVWVCLIPMLPIHFIYSRYIR